MSLRIGTNLIIEAISDRVRGVNSATGFPHFQSSQYNSCKYHGIPNNGAHQVPRLGNARNHRGSSLLLNNKPNEKNNSLYHKGEVRYV
jgi:hypothetical protein